MFKVNYQLQCAKPHEIISSLLDTSAIRSGNYLINSKSFRNVVVLYNFVCSSYVVATALHLLIIHLKEQFQNQHRLQMDLLLIFLVWWAV